MSSLDMLDAVIGMVFVYLTLSLMVTALGEGVGQATGLRGKILKRAVDRLIGPWLGNQVRAHPRIQALQKDSRRAPSYIPDRLFAEVLLDVVLSGEFADLRANPAAFDRAFQQGLTKQECMPIEKTLQGFWKTANFDTDRLLEQIVVWFNDTGDRSTGWFRRSLNLWLFWLGFMVAVLLNVDSIHMYSTLSHNDALRAEFVQKATAAVQSQQPAATTEQPATTGDQPAPATATTVIPDICKKYAIPDTDCNAMNSSKALLTEVVPLVGWTMDAPAIKLITWLKDERKTETQSAQIHEVYLLLPPLLLALVGWFVTAAALSLGAPFWFDLLQKLVSLRSSVKAEPSTTAEEEAAKQASPKVVVASVGSSVVALSKTIDSDSFANFHADRLAFDRSNALWLARFAALAYGAPAEVRAQLESWGMTGGLYEDLASDTQFIVARGPRAAVLAFRGTEVKKPADVLADVECQTIAAPWDVACSYRLHQGFARALQSAWPMVEKALADQSIIADKLPLWVTGHSLGGALALLAGMRIKAEGVAVMGSVYTFGQPRVGDAIYAQSIDQLLGGRYFRGVNNRDAVPLVPPPVLGSLHFAHAGSVFYFNEFGLMMQDPPLWYRGLDKVALTTNSAVLKSKLQEFAGDHAITQYVQLCQRATLVT